MPVFEVAAVLKPTRKEAEDGALETVILAPKIIVAVNEQSAAVMVAKDIPADAPMTRVEMLVRPF